MKYAASNVCKADVVLDCAGKACTTGLPPVVLEGNMAAEPPASKTLTYSSLVPEPPGNPTSVCVYYYEFLSLCSFGGEITRVKLFY